MEQKVQSGLARVVLLIALAAMLRSQPKRIGPHGPTPRLDRAGWRSYASYVQAVLCQQGRVSLCALGSPCACAPQKWKH